jgi:hypothetical protein
MAPSVVARCALGRSNLRIRDQCGRDDDSINKSVPAAQGKTHPGGLFSESGEPGAAATTARD